MRNLSGNPSVYDKTLGKEDLTMAVPMTKIRSVIAATVAIALILGLAVVVVGALNIPVPILSDLADKIGL